MHSSTITIVLMEDYFTTQNFGGTLHEHDQNDQLYHLKVSPLNYP